MTNLDLFLKELSELTRKYNLAICGCGCCGSPAIDTIDSIHSHEVATNLEYDEENKIYTVNEV